MWCIEIGKRQAMERPITFITVVVERVGRRKPQLWEKFIREVFFGICKWDILDYDGCIDEIRVLWFR